MIADRIRRKVIGTPFAHGKSQPLGGRNREYWPSAFSPALDSAEAIVRALIGPYHAKSHGKNRATISRGSTRRAPNGPAE